jgi:hypothetical protein
MTFDLTHARHDPAHCLAPGLFRSLKRGDRKRMKLDFTYSYGKKELIEFKGPEPLGADDLRILQGLIAMAGPNGVILHPEPKTDAGVQLRLFLEPKWEAVQQDALVVKGSYYRLAKEVGYSCPDSGKVAKQIRECVERLWTVSVIVQSGSRRVGFRILSDYASDTEEDRLFVALNPRIAEAILGRRSHARIELSEVRALQSDPARLIHQRLCGYIDPGKTHPSLIAIETLCGYAWPDSANDEAMKKRRQAARRALGEIAGCGWVVEEVSKGKFRIGRPSLTASGNVSAVKRER